MSEGGGAPRIRPGGEAGGAEQVAHAEVNVEGDEKNEDGGAQICSRHTGGGAADVGSPVDNRLATMKTTALALWVMAPKRNPLAPASNGWRDQWASRRRRRRLVAPRTWVRMPPDAMEKEAEPGEEKSEKSRPGAGESTGDRYPTIYRNRA